MYIHTYDSISYHIICCVELQYSSIVISIQYSVVSSQYLLYTALPTHIIHKGTTTTNFPAHWPRYGSCPTYRVWTKLNYNESLYVSRLFSSTAVGLLIESLEGARTTTRILPPTPTISIVQYGIVYCMIVWYRKVKYSIVSYGVMQLMMRHQFIVDYRIVPRTRRSPYSYGRDRTWMIVFQIPRKHLKVAVNTSRDRLLIQDFLQTPLVPLNIYIYIYIYVQRERETHICIYIYITSNT